MGREGDDKVIDFKSRRFQKRHSKLYAILCKLLALFHREKKGTSKNKTAV